MKLTGVRQDDTELQGGMSHDERFGKLHQVSGSILSDHHDILQSDSAYTGIIETGFHCDDMFRQEGSAGGGSHAGHFMHFQTESMTRAVKKSLVLPGLWML